MIALQNVKIKPAILPGAIVKNGAFTSQVIDLNDFEGADYIEFVALLGATDVALTVLRVMESDTITNPTTLGASPALVIDATVKPAATDDNGLWIVGVDLRGPRERYLQLQATAANGSNGAYLTAWAQAKPANVSSNAADRGAVNADYGR